MEQARLDVRTDVPLFFEHTEVPAIRRSVRSRHDFFERACLLRYEYCRVPDDSWQAVFRHAANANCSHAYKPPSFLNDPQRTKIEWNGTYLDTRRPFVRGFPLHRRSRRRRPSGICGGDGRGAWVKHRRTIDKYPVLRVKIRYVFPLSRFKYVPETSSRGYRFVTCGVRGLPGNSSVPVVAGNVAMGASIAPRV